MMFREAETGRSLCLLLRQLSPRESTRQIQFHPRAFGPVSAENFFAAASGAGLDLTLLVQIVPAAAAAASQPPDSAARC
jgi:hypothetical protein